MDEIFMVHYFMTKAFVYIEGGEGVGHYLWVNKCNGLVLDYTETISCQK